MMGLRGESNRLKLIRLLRCSSAASWTARLQSFVGTGRYQLVAILLNDDARPVCTSFGQIWLPLA